MAADDAGKWWIDGDRLNEKTTHIDHLEISSNPKQERLERFKQRKLEQEPFVSTITRLNETHFEREVWFLDGSLSVWQCTRAPSLF